MKKQANLKMQDTTFGYTDASNPFGDANLTKAFVWKKKYDKERAMGVDPAKFTKEQRRQKQLELHEEIEKVKARRRAREEEQAQLEEMKAQMQRDIDTSVAEDWEEKEEEFHRNQAKLRSILRIREGREKPIDILAKNLSLFHSNETLNPDVPVDLDVELAEPYKIFDGLSERDLLYLKHDIQEHVDLGTDLEYWGALIIVCDDELLKEKHKRGYGPFGKEKRNRYGTHAAVEKDVLRLLENKNHRELEKLNQQITKKIEKGSQGTGEAIDIPYWESVLKTLVVWKAKAFLRELHQQLLRKRLKELKKYHLEDLKKKGTKFKGNNRRKIYKWTKCGRF